MNRKTIERWISMDLDGELSPQRQKKLSRILKQHPEYRALRDRWAENRSLNRTIVTNSAPPVEKLLAGLQREIRQKKAEPEARGYMPAFRPAWALAAVLAVAALSYSFFKAGGPDSSPEIYSSDQQIEVESVETEIPGGMAVVYKDESTGLTVIWVDVEVSEEG